LKALQLIHEAVESAPGGVLVNSFVV
jgi:hypothetical protein